MNGQEHQRFWDDFTRRPIEQPLKQRYAADYLTQLDSRRSFEEEN